MTKHILGISAFYHDSAAALLRDGEIVAAAQEERFTRRKHDPRFPARAVEFCLRQGGIGPCDLDIVAFYERPLAKWDRLMETYLGFAPQGYELFEEAMPTWAELKLQLPQRIRATLPGFTGDLYFADHHESHAASAFFPSPFDASAILTVDAVGEWSTSALGMGSGNRITLSHEQRFPHSLGMLYSAFTYYTGFRVNSGEYKLMGLAPYGKPKYATLILEHLVRIMDDGSLWLDMTYFNYGQGLTMTSPKFHDLFGGPPRKPEALITQKEMDLAASVQVVCEDVMLRTAHHLYDKTGARAWSWPAAWRSTVWRMAACFAKDHSRTSGSARGWRYVARSAPRSLPGTTKMNQPRQAPTHDAQRGSLLGPSFDNDDIGLFLSSVGATRRIDDERVAGSGGSSGRGREGDRVVPGTDGVRPSCTRLPQHHRGCALATNAAEDERLDQVSRIVPSVRSLRPA